MLYEEIKKQGINWSAFVQKMLEREFAGDFHQLKINELKEELASAEAENTHIQTQQQEQEKLAEETYRKAEEAMLERRRQNMLRRKEGI